MDVDGVINSLNHLYTNGKVRFEHDTTPHRLNGYNVWIPSYMPKLIQAIHKTADLYWCTTWRDEANTFISPALGIPSNIPVIDDGTAKSSPSWKFTACLPTARSLNEKGQKILWIEDFRGHTETKLTNYLTYVDTDKHNEGVLLPQHLPHEFLDLLITTGGYDGPRHITPPREMSSHFTGQQHAATSV